LKKQRCDPGKRIDTVRAVDADRSDSDEAW